MNNIILKSEKVAKVFNNNIILVNSENKEKILFAKGIGFAKKIGDVIPKGTKVDKIFIIESKDNIQNFKNIIKKIDNDFFAVCEEGIYEISNQINKDLNENIHIGLIDHLYFAVSRIKNKEEIENPFLVEIETLYPKEFMLAQMIARKVSNHSNVILPEGEVGFIALHIHSAINNGKISNTLKNSYLSNTIIEHVEDSLDIEIDRKSLDYARFLTHIRFAIQRIINNNRIKNDLVAIIKEKYDISYKIAIEVGDMIAEELKTEVTEEEISYLAMHIERFRTTVTYN